MNLNSSVIALVLGLMGAADALAATPTCREVRSEAVDRVCRWQVGKGEFVNIYYGHPPPAPPPEPAPVRSEIRYVPVYYAAPAYYGYGYALPVAIGGKRRPHGVAVGAVGRPPAFRGGFQGAVANRGFQGRVGVPPPSGGSGRIWP
jgi:hypothetical protein